MYDSIQHKVLVHMNVRCTNLHVQQRKIKNARKAEADRNKIVNKGRS